MSHRLPMARAARAAGFEVHVATRVDRHGEAIEREGFALHPLPWRRGSLNPGHVVPLISAVRKVYRDVDPDLAHHVSVEASVIGSLAAVGLRVVCVNAITGFGGTFLGGSIKAKLARGPVAGALRWALRRPNSVALVQNPDDRATVARLGVDPNRIALIPGSGVDVEAMMVTPEPAGPVTIAFAGRLLEYKGIRTLVAAHDLLTKRGRDVRLLIAGTPDPTNRGSVSADEIAGWKKRASVSYLGQVKDIRTVWAAAHIAALPSRGGEGVPLSLIEAAACGRPLVATDTPGCREIVRNGVNGLLVPPDDAEALAQAIDRLANDANLRRAFGQASRELAEREFSGARVGRDLVALYRRVLPAGKPTRG